MGWSTKSVIMGIVACRANSFHSSPVSAIMPCIV